MSATTIERIAREREALRRLSVGHTKFREDFVPRLERVQLGPRSVGYTETSINRLIKELIAETETAPKIVPPPNKKRRASKK